MGYVLCILPVYARHCVVLSSINLYASPVMSTYI